MKRRLIALACVLAAVCALMLPAWGAADAEVYLLAVNEKFCDLPGGALPLTVKGVIYIPYTTFDRNATGVDLGVYYGIDQSQGTVLNLYSMNGRLSFIVSQGRCEDGEGNAMSFKAVSRNGILYVPAASVCRFFGLQYSYLPTTDRGTLIRICNSRAHYQDNEFLANSTSAMTYRYNQIMQNLRPSDSGQPTASQTPLPTPTPTGSPEAGKEKVRVYLAVDASELDGDVTAMFPAGVYALLLFRPDALAAKADVVRRAVAQGHSVGLKVEGTEEEALEQLARGNELLTHIARTRTRVVSAPAELAGRLAREGWVCWQSNVSGETANAILSSLGTKRELGRVSLPGRSAVISRVISEIRREGYDVRRPLETEL